MKIVNSTEFKEITKEGNVVVDFFADWCGPCKMLSPIMEKIESEYNDITFIKVNCDDEMDLASEYGIMSIPAVFFLKDGQVVDKFMGMQQENYIKDKIEESFR